MATGLASGTVKPAVVVCRGACQRLQHRRLPPIPPRSWGSHHPWGPICTPSRCHCPCPSPAPSPPPCPAPGCPAERWPCPRSQDRWAAEGLGALAVSKADAGLLPRQKCRPELCCCRVGATPALGNSDASVGPAAPHAEHWVSLGTHSASSLALSLAPPPAAALKPRVERARTPQSCCPPVPTLPRVRLPAVGTVTAFGDGPGSLQPLGRVLGTVLGPSVPDRYVCPAAASPGPGRATSTKQRLTPGWGMVPPSPARAAVGAEVQGRYSSSWVPATWQWGSWVLDAQS